MPGRIRKGWTEWGKGYFGVAGFVDFVGFVRFAYFPQHGFPGQERIPAERCGNRRCIRLLWGIWASSQVGAGVAFYDPSCLLPLYTTFVRCKTILHLHGWKVKIVSRPYLIWTGYTIKKKCSYSAEFFPRHFLLRHIHWFYWIAYVQYDRRDMVTGRSFHNSWSGFLARDNLKIHFLSRSSQSSGVFQWKSQSKYKH